MSPSPGGRRLATVTIPAPDLQAEPFLRHADGEARGFWARWDRWVVHRGVVEELSVPGGGDTERFEAVAEAAAALVRHPIMPLGAVRAPKVRFYGGFAFRDDHEAAGVWSAFPKALFHVPAFELEGDASGDAWLRARALVPPEDEVEALQRLRRSAESLRAELTSRGSPGPPGARSVPGWIQATDRDAWEAAVESSLDAIRRGRVTKVVLARTLDVRTEQPLDPVDMVTHLRVTNQGSHVFMFEPRPGSALVGAAPETVATLKDGVFHATAVAGSVGRGTSPREQAELATRLLASGKDRAEQRIALDDMVARLETVAHQVRADPEPHVLTLARIQHLETEIRASVSPETGILDLLRLLHPTPAVCGLPRDAALDFLAREERFDRGWYAGPVGFFDGERNGYFAPALRTAVVHDGTWRAFAGAGIVEGSVPRLEWEETGMKFTPILDALDAAGAALTGAPADAGSPGVGGP